MDVSFQLYSAREFTPWPKVFETVARLGYAQVEGFNGVFEDVAAIRALLTLHGLSMPSTHFGIDLLEQNPDTACEIAKQLDIKTLYLPHLDVGDRPKDRDGWAAFARRLDTIGVILRDHGLRYGWHNHDFEFEPLEDGSIPMDILLNTAPDMDWEADIAWIARSGTDPFDWIKRYGNRIKAAHVKDIAPAGTCLDEDGWADVGHGTMDWAALTDALRSAGCDLFVIEHDKPSDLERFAARSIAQFQTY